MRGELMNVPKCKECDFFVEELSKFVMNHKNKTYWCTKARNLNQGIFRSNILAKEIRTSPKWCPKRSNGV